MAFYDLDNPLRREAFKARVNHLYKRGGIVELSDKQNRTLKQNAYLHVLLGYFGLEYGEPAEYVKFHFYKKEVNPDIYCVKKQDRLLGREVEYVRSSADLTVEELGMTIDRFRDWSLKVAGIYLPEATNQVEGRYMEAIVNSQRRYT